MHSHTTRCASVLVHLHSLQVAEPWRHGEKSNHARMSMYACMHACMQACMCVRVCVCVRVHVYIHTYVRTYIHT